MDCSSIIEGALKYRDGKKWKQRWAVLDKLSPVADVLQLQLYRDSRDRAKGAATKASLSLHNVLALQTGFTLDKESHTLGLLCQDVTLVVAFDTRERLLQWKVKVEATLGEEHQFLVQLVQVPSKSRIATGPARMHIRDHRFCLAAGTPPRLLSAWSTHDLRRYGVVDGRVVWEGGSRCGRWSGVHVAISDAPHSVTHSLDQSSRGHITTPPPRPNSNNSSGSGGRGEIRSEAAKWIREVSALDLSSDTLSLAPSEATTIATSPREAFPRVTCACYSSTTPRDGYTRTNCECGHGSITPPPWERRSSCQSSWGPLHASNVSSMGVSATESEGGWWAEALARGSWEGVTGPESLYDTPRPLAFVHAESQQSVQQQQMKQQQKQLHQQIQQKLQHHITRDRNNSSGESPQPQVNPMDNYDIPPPPRPEPATHYDTPRRLLPSMTDTSNTTLNQSVDGSGWNDGSNVPVGPGCGQVLGWAGSICGSKDNEESVTGPIRVDGQGRMPVVDAYTGTIIRPPPPTPAPTPLPVNNPHQVEVESPPVYAVINKKKGVGKPRCPTPPPTPPPLPSRPGETKPDPKANYANLEFTESLSLYENARDIKSRLSDNKSVVSAQNNTIPKCPARPPSQISQYSGAKNEPGNNVGSSLSLPSYNHIAKPEQTQPANTCPHHSRIHHPTLPLKKQQQRQVIDKTSSLPHPAKTKCSTTVPYQMQMNGTDNDQLEKQEDSQHSTACQICQTAQSIDSSDLYIPMGPRRTLEDPDYLPMQPKLQTSTSEDLLLDRSDADQSRRQMVSEGNNKHVAGIARCGRSHSVVSSERSTQFATRRSTSADSRPRESMIESPSNTPQSTPTHKRTTDSLRMCERGINRCDAAVDSGCDLHLDITETLMVDGTLISIKQQEEKPIGIINDEESNDKLSCVLRHSSDQSGNKSNVSNRDSASSSDSGVYESPRALDRLLSSHCLHTSLPRPRRPACSHLSGGITTSCQDLGLGNISSSSGTSAGDAKSTSSGASDMSDYLDTLSLSSHSSSDHDRLMARSSVNTLRPRSGREYSRLDRCAICPEEKKTLPVLGEALPH